MDEQKPYLNQGWTQMTKKISSSCSTSGTSCVTVVNYPVIIPELQKDGIDLRKPITFISGKAIVLSVLGSMTFSFGHCVVCPW
jgi:hypothetical protein